jgi:hypothetical protein
MRAPSLDDHRQGVPAVLLEQVAGQVVAEGEVDALPRPGAEHQGLDGRPGVDPPHAAGVDEGVRQAEVEERRKGEMLKFSGADFYK